MAKKTFISRHRFGLGVFISVFIFVFASFGLVVANGEAVNPKDQHLINLKIKGQEEIVPSRATTVGEFLSKQSVRLGESDVVVPSKDATITTDNFSIEVMRAQPTTIVDGASTISLLSPYQDPRLAVEEAGIVLYPADKVELDYSGNPSITEIIGRKISVKRATLIYVNIYGTTVEHRTNKKIVSEVLAEMSILPEVEDSVLPSYATVISANLVISITRFGQEVINVEEAIAIPQEIVTDKNLPIGTNTVSVEGRAGKRLVTYELNFENGIEVTRHQIQETIVEQPVARVVIRGSSAVIGENKQALMIAAGLSPADFAGADFIISHESGWCATKWQGQWGYCPPSYIEKYSGAETDTSLGFGLCQSTPAIKMATAGNDWRTNAVTQLKWCTSYARGRYGSWQKAYEAWAARAASGRGWW